MHKDLLKTTQLTLCEPVCNPLYVKTVGSLFSFIKNPLNMCWVIPINRNTLWKHNNIYQLTSVTYPQNIVVVQ